MKSVIVLRDVCQSRRGETEFRLLLDRGQLSIFWHMRLLRVVVVTYPPRNSGHASQIRVVEHHRLNMSRCPYLACRSLVR